MDLVIRKVHREDAGSLKEMNELFNGTGCNTLQNIEKSLEENGPEQVAIALADGIAAGFICGQIFSSMCYPLPYGEITELFVREEFRRQGVGRMLTAYMEQLLCEEGVSKIQLLTDVNNSGAQRFYDECGYQKDNELMYRKKMQRKTGE